MKEYRSRPEVKERLRNKRIVKKYIIKAHKLKIKNFSIRWSKNRTEVWERFNHNVLYDMNVFPYGKPMRRK